MRHPFRTFPFVSHRTDPCSRAVTRHSPFTGAIYAKRDEERKNKVANAEPSGSSSAVRSRAAAKEL